jgi:hypothetical protein
MLPLFIELLWFNVLFKLLLLGLLTLPLINELVNELLSRPYF